MQSGRASSTVRRLRKSDRPVEVGVSLGYFSVTRNGGPICSVLLTGGKDGMAEAPVVEELQFVGFELNGREADAEYAVRVGDIPL